VTKMIYIPPFQMIEQIHRNTHALMLPHLILEPSYRRAFRQNKALGIYTILDNGAAEGEKIAASRLASMSHSYKINELVLPDEMGNPERTYGLALDFLAENRSKLSPHVKLGYVLHGRTAGEIATAYHRAAGNEVLWREISVVYLPRLAISPERPATRIIVAEGLLNDPKFDKEIHFLGMSPHYMAEPKMVAEYLYGKVRSIDTSAPFVYAMRNRSIDDPVELWRDQSTYFSTYMSDAQKQLAMENCEMMNDWVTQAFTR
jgi:hypothetical protein